MISTHNFDGLIIEVFSFKDNKSNSSALSNEPSNAEPSIVVVSNDTATNPSTSTSKVIELNMSELPGTLNTMESVRKKPASAPAKTLPSNANQIVSPSVTLPQPAASTSTEPLVDDLACSLDYAILDDAEPGANPSPISDEDWVILEQAMITSQHIPCYDKLLEMNSTALVSNCEEFVCSVCEMFVFPKQGVVLKGCLHNFCRLCLVDEIKNGHDLMGQVKCPLRIARCDGFMEDEEIKALLGGDYDMFTLKVFEMHDASIREKERQEEDDRNALLPMLLGDDLQDYIENFEPFECAVCTNDIEIGQGVILKNCLHMFCKDCIIQSVKHAEDFVVKCPYIDDIGGCEFQLQEREIRNLVPDELFEKHLEKSLKLYEGASETAFHCKTPDCRGFIEVDANVRGFTCMVCGRVNCIGCKVIHEGKNCQEYQDEINPDGKHQRDNAESENTIRNLIASNEAMYCPRCGIPVMKNQGCDSIICTTCKLAICWCTKKPRHPITKQDGTVIDGCHCMEKLVRCHPLCQNCH